jgi:hypothetical protein
LIDIKRKTVQFFPEKITPRHAKDTGMAMVLLSLILYLLTGKDWLIPLAVGLLAVNMIVPGLYKPLAYVWYGLSHLLGTVVSRMLLSAIFFLVVTPMGLFRRLLRRDSLRLRQWKKSGESVLKTRDHVFTAEDITKPY